MPEQSSYAIPETETSRRPKNIVLLSDGTGNSAHDPFKTNIWRLYQALDLNRREAGANDWDQIACYDDGVGTESSQFLAIPGLAFGFGLKRNVLDLYSFLCRNYRPGDRIYCFGFSRGAFTVRVLAGLISNQGVIDTHGKTPMGEAELQRLARAAFRAYRERYHFGRNPFNPFHLLGRLWRWFRDKAIKQYDNRTGRTHYDPEWNLSAPIAFVGVFDTVAAYGLPIDEMTRAWEWIFPLSFPDNRLSKNIERACHALALDDERHSFHPELWTEKEKEEPAPKSFSRRLADQFNKIFPGLFPTPKDMEKAQRCKTTQPVEAKALPERLLQVWFAGMHSDVGGSYPDDAMSFVSLEWMLTEAEHAATRANLPDNAKLRFKAQEKHNVKAAANARGPIHDSRRGTGSFYRYRPRKLETLLNDTNAKVTIGWPKIHASVFERIKDGTDGYASIVLPQKYEVYEHTGEFADLRRREDGELQQRRYFPDGRVEEVAVRDELAMPEHATRAADRLHRHEKVWDLVWIKRVVYFVTVFLGFALFLFPLYLPATDACEGSACGLAPLVHAVGWVLPGMFATWVKAYESHPGWFVSLAGLMIAFTKISIRLQRRIFDTMHAIWKPILAEPGNIVTPAPEPANRLYRWRTHPRYLKTLELVRNNVLVPVVGFITAAVFVLGACRITFTMFETAGCFCQAPTGRTQPAQFDNKSLCWWSGRAVTKGRRYRLTLAKPPEAEWNDRTIPSPISGFKTEDIAWPKKAIFLAATLLRRDLTGHWFQPIARIGESGNDEYLLAPKGSADRHALVAEFTARRSGDLFLYLNDATLPVPAAWQYFYNNNQGQADFTLEELDENGNRKNLVTASIQ
jgi:uncharacterized protein (DUF2235 family)